MQVPMLQHLNVSAYSSLLLFLMLQFIGYCSFLYAETACYSLNTALLCCCNIILLL